MDELEQDRIMNRREPIDRLEDEIRQTVQRDLPAPTTSPELALVIEELKTGQVPAVINGVSTLVENQAMITAAAMERSATALRERAEQLEKGAAALRTRTMNAIQDLRDAVEYERMAFQLNAAAVLASDEVTQEN